MFTLAELQAMSQLETGDIDQSKLIDVQTVKIDPMELIVQRMESYLKQIKNPYCFMCGNTPVKISFSDDGKPLSDKLAEHFIRQKTE